MPRNRFLRRKESCTALARGLDRVAKRELVTGDKTHILAVLNQNVVILRQLMISEAGVTARLEQ